MQSALKKFAVDENSVSPYIYHILLGNDIDVPPIRNVLPSRYANIQEVVVVRVIEARHLTCALSVASGAAPGVPASQLPRVGSPGPEPLTSLRHLAGAHPRIQPDPGAVPPPLSACMPARVPRSKRPTHSARRAAPEGRRGPQGPPGTGKTVTSAALVYHLVQQTKGRVLVCAPSNVAVDHLCEKIHMTGLRVVRLVARSREGMTSAVSFLGLQEQVRKNDTVPELQKLIKLRDMQGELSATDEFRYRKLMRDCEMEILKVRAHWPTAAGLSTWPRWH